MNQKAYWDEASATKQFTTPFQAGAFSRHAPKSARILDVGCGYGRTLHELHGMGYQSLTGIDFSGEMIARGKREYPHLDLRVMNTAQIDFADSSFDAVILFAVLTCIRQDEEQAALIAEIRRVLRPGGILYVNDFLLNDDARNTARYRDYHTAHGGAYGVFALPEGAVVRHHDEQWITELLRPFDRLEYEQLTFTTMNGNQSNGFYFIGAKPCICGTSAAT